MIKCSGRYLCFLLTYFVYVASYRKPSSVSRKVHDRFHELSEYEYRLHSRIRREVRQSPTSDDLGVKNVGNKTDCNTDNRRNSSSVGNCTVTEEFTDINNHEYYRSHYYSRGEPLFVDLNSESIKNSMKVEKHENLSSSYKKAFRVPIDFHFPFYGNYVDRIIVTTGGFINIGPKFHSFVHKVHYIAPFMADFDPRASNKSVVYIAKNTESIIIQWTDFLLYGIENANKPFTFQISLHKNGTVIMAYKKIPVEPSKIKIAPGDVRITVGFSDGFIITYKRYDRFKLVVHNLIYSYHKVNFPIDKVRSNTAYKLVLLPNCIQYKTCSSCLNESKYATNFTCRWCPELNQCSDALDWHRQKWLTHCRHSAYNDVRKCHSNRDVIKAMQKRTTGSSSSTAGLVIGMLLFAALIAFVIIFIYAYTHPHSKPGVFLIESRRPWSTFHKLKEEDENDNEAIVKANEFSSA